MLRKSKVGEDLLAFSKQQMEKSTGSPLSGDILTVHLEVVSDSTLMTLGVILELCNITLFPDTCLDLFCISLSMRKVSGRGSVMYLAERSLVSLSFVSFLKKSSQKKIYQFPVPV